MAFPVNPYFLASGFTLLLLPVLFIGNWLLRGFFWKLIKVKSSQGKLVLLRVYTLTTDYFAVGEVIDNAVKWKDKKKTGRTTPLTDNGLIYRCWGVACIDTDEATNCFFKRDGRGITSNDSELNDDLILRALNKPSQEKKILIAILIIVIVLILLCIANLAFSFKIYQAVQQLTNVGASTMTPGIA